MSQAEPKRPGPAELRKTGLPILAILIAGALPLRASGDVTGQACDILDATGVRGGLVVHVGCAGGELTAALCAGDGYLLNGLARDAAEVAKAREHIRGKGLGDKVSVALLTGKQLPYADDLVNLVVAEELGDVPMAEVLRVLAPGGVARIGGERISKPWPRDIDEWTHFLHDPTNNAVSRDRVVDQPRSIQWVSGPRWGRSHEEMASMSAAVTANGRMFYIVDEAPLASIRYLGQWKLIGRDAFNDVLLWKRDIPRWSDHLRHFRAGPPDVYDDQDPFAAFEARRGGRLLALSPETGRKTHGIPLDVPSVSDGLIACRGRLLVSLRDGTVACFASGER